jgi:hypothetical protein
MRDKKSLKKKLKTLKFPDEKYLEKASKHI